MIQEMSSCLALGTKSTQPVHFVLIMAPRSSKASSQLMAGWCGEISENILMCQCQRSDLLAQSVAWGYSLIAKRPLIRYAQLFA